VWGQPIVYTQKPGNHENHKQTNPPHRRNGGQVNEITAGRNKRMKPRLLDYGLMLLTASATLFGAAAPVQAQDKRPNIVVLMTDDTGWNDFGAYGGGVNLGHATPKVDQVARITKLVRAVTE
jgi:hypothetical protein